MSEPVNAQVLTDYIRCCELVAKWAPILTEDNISNINSMARRDVENGLYDYMLKAYSDRLRSHAENLGLFNDGANLNPIGAGVFCFTGQLILYYSQFGNWMTNDPGDDIIKGILVEDHAFNFSIMYLYVDYFLDSTSISGASKKDTLVTLFSLLYDPYSGKAPPGMEGLVEAYKSILSVSPQSKKVLVDLFMVEVETTKVQNNGNLSRADYMNAALKKGGITGLAIQSITGAPYYQDCYDIGSVLQLIDDIMDVYEDRDDGIHTIATYDLVKYGCLDHIFFQCVDILDKLDNKFLFFKLMLMQVITYTSSMEGRFSKLLKRRIKPYTSVRWIPGSHAMDICNQRVYHLLQIYDKS